MVEEEGCGCSRRRSLVTVDRTKRMEKKNAFEDRGDGGGGGWATGRSRAGRRGGRGGIGERGFMTFFAFFSSRRGKAIGENLPERSMCTSSVWC